MFAMVPNAFRKSSFVPWWGMLLVVVLIALLALRHPFPISIGTKASSCGSVVSAPETHLAFLAGVDRLNPLALRSFSPSQRWEREFPPGQMHSILYNQQLCNFAFHSVLKQRILDILAPITDQDFVRGYILVVGLADGHDAIQLAARGFHVIVFEPLVSYIDAFRLAVSQTPGKDRFTIHPYGAASVRKTEKITYQNREEPAEFAPIDDFVTQPIVLWSLDTQGTEYDVFLGAQKTMARGVIMLWVETTACNPVTKSIYQALDKDYVMFDITWWGDPKSRAGTNRGWYDHVLDNFVWKDRPTEFEQYYDFYCGIARRQFLWLQTDFIAIRRDYLKTYHVQDLSSLFLHCDEQPGICVLRDLLNNRH